MMQALELAVGRDDLTVCDPFFLGLGARSGTRYSFPSGRCRLEFLAVGEGAPARVSRLLLCVTEAETAEWRAAAPLSVDSGLLSVSSRPGSRVVSPAALAELARMEGPVHTGDDRGWTFSCGWGDGEVAVREGFDRRGRRTALELDCVTLTRRPAIADAAATAAHGEAEWTLLAPAVLGGSATDARNQVLVRPRINRRLAAVEREVAARLLAGAEVDYSLSPRYAGASAVAAALDVEVDDRRSTLE